MKTINFPLDFIVTENQYLFGSTNYIHIRKNGSIISIFESIKRPGVYEVWDERYMQDIEIMTSNELYVYLKKEPTRELLQKISLN
jgi:hypothetical protein